MTSRAADDTLTPSPARRDCKRNSHGSQDVGAQDVHGGQAEGRMAQGAAARILTVFRRHTALQYELPE